MSGEAENDVKTSQSSKAKDEAFVGRCNRKAANEAREAIWKLAAPRKENVATRKARATEPESCRTEEASLNEPQELEYAINYRKGERIRSH